MAGGDTDYCTFMDEALDDMPAEKASSTEDGHQRHIGTPLPFSPNRPHGCRKTFLPQKPCHSLMPVNAHLP